MKFVCRAWCRRRINAMGEEFSGGKLGTSALASLLWRWRAEHEDRVALKQRVRELEARLRGAQ